MEVKRDKLVILSIDACPPPRGHTLPTQVWVQYLPGCIQNVQVGRLIVNADPDLVCILYRREEHTCGKKQGSENLPHRRGSPGIQGFKRWANALPLSYIPRLQLLTFALRCWHVHM